MKLITKKSNSMLSVERYYKKPVHELLYELHYEQKLSYQQMADEMLVSKTTVAKWMVLAEITARVDIC